MLIGKVVRLQPNKEQESLFRQFAGTNRFAWNESKSFYDKVWREENRYATLSDMMKHLQVLKHNNSDYAWLNDIPEAITKQAIKDLIKAYKKAYQDRKKDKSNSDKYLPKYKKRGKCEESFYQRTDNIHKTDNTHIKITGIKKPVKCIMLKDIDLPEHIQNPRIKFDGEYWYLSYSYEVNEDSITSYNRDYLGIDLGIKDLAIFSNGTHHRNINKDANIKKLRKRLKHIQRLISKKYEANVTTDKNGKKIYHKTKNIEKLEQAERMIYRRISNIQKTYMYEVVNDAIRTKPHTIILEDLNVKGMLQNPKLARAIQEENLSRFRQIMTYKCELNGICLEIADRWYPSSKLCSCCGHIKKDLKLSDRTYKCNNCGIEIDRDFNAAINLELYPTNGYKKIKIA